MLICMCVHVRVCKCGVYMVCQAMYHGCVHIYIHIASLTHTAAPYSPLVVACILLLDDLLLNFKSRPLNLTDRNQALGKPLQITLTPANIAVRLLIICVRTK